MRNAVVWVAIGLFLVAAGEGDGTPVPGGKKLAEAMPGKPLPPVERGDIVVWPAVGAAVRDKVMLPTWIAPTEKPDDDAFVSVVIAADQTVYCGGGTVDLPELRKRLLAHAERKRVTDHPMRPSAVPVLILASKDVRWRAVQFVMQCCAMPDVRINRIYLAMRDAKGGLVTVPCFLPIDRGIGPRRDSIPTLTVELKRKSSEKVTRVKLLDQEIGSDDAGFRICGKRIRQIMQHNKELPGEINAWASVPYGHVMKTFEIFKAAGLKKVTFLGAPLPSALLNPKKAVRLDEPREFPLPGAAEIAKVTGDLPPVRRGPIDVWPGDRPEVRRKILLPTWPLPVATPKEGEFVEILVAADGGLTVGGKAVDLKKLTMRLLVHAERDRDRTHPLKISRSPVVVHASKDVRWRELQWVLQACADPDVRIWRIYLAMRDAGGKFVYVPVFLPLDGPSVEGRTCLRVVIKRKQHETASRVSFQGEGIGSDETAFLLLRERVAERAKAGSGKHYGLINAWAWTPYQDVMTALSTFHAAKVDPVYFTGAPPPGRRPK